MRTVLLILTLAAGAAAQVAPIPNTTLFKDTRTAVNTALGNAASITGSYSNPSWITALAGAKITGNLGGNAGTASALAALPTPCAAGSYPLGILANGNSTNCTAISTRRTICIPFGAKNGAVLANTDLADSDLYPVDAAATLIEVTVRADAGTPNIILGRDRAGSVVNLTSAALATAASGGLACSNTGGTTSVFGGATCAATLQNTGLNSGDWLLPVSGTAGGTAKQMSVCLTWTVN